MATPDATKIHQGPGSLWMGCHVPANGSRLLIDINGAPTETSVVADPAAAPSLSSVAAGALASATYYVEYTLVTPNGETKASPEASLLVALDNELVVNAPARVAGALGWNVYISVTTGTEKKQNTNVIPFGTNWTQTAVPSTTTAAPPGANSTAASFGGAVEGASTLLLTPKLEELSADQVAAPIDVVLTGEMEELEATMMETDLAKLFAIIAHGSYYGIGTDAGLPAGAQNYEEISFGGLIQIPTQSVAIVSPRRNAAGKFVVSQLYKAYQAQAVQLPFQRGKATVVKVKFNGLADGSRPTGDQVGKLYRQT